MNKAVKIYVLLRDCDQSSIRLSTSFDMFTKVHMSLSKFNLASLSQVKLNWEEKSVTKRGAAWLDWSQKFSPQ